MDFNISNGRLVFVTPPPVAASKETVGCISLGRTGSMALAAAIRQAGFEDAVYLHYLGRRARALKQTKPEPMLDLASQVSRRLEDPARTFRLVTSVRDPVARIISQAFYRAEQAISDGAAEAVRSPEALRAWWDGSLMAGPDYWAVWFDDTFKATFGFDFRDHAFDHRRKSLRFESDRLKLLVVRQDDDALYKEAELSWLLERGDVFLAKVNETGSGDGAKAYRAFLEHFTAPTSWLSGLYESAVFRHFYTEDERRALMQRWRGDGAKTS